MVQTALAVEAAGSYKASAWAPAMFEVGDPPGEVCYTYADCLKLIREGKDIDYEGVTGPGPYTDGGVNAVTPRTFRSRRTGPPASPCSSMPQKGLDASRADRDQGDLRPREPAQQVPVVAGSQPV